MYLLRAMATRGLVAVTSATVLAGCAATERAQADRAFADACARAPAAKDGEIVVVMRDRSSSTTAAGVGPGVEALGDNVVLLGPVVAGSKASGVLTSSDRTNVEMRPCPAPTGLQE